MAPNLNRRRLFLGAISLITAPSIVRASSLMASSLRLSIEDRAISPVRPIRVEHLKITKTMRILIEETETLKPGGFAIPDGNLTKFAKISLVDVTYPGDIIQTHGIDIEKEILDGVKMSLGHPL